MKSIVNKKDFMETIKYFFAGYFCPTFSFNQLDSRIQDYKTNERENYTNDLISELHQIIITKNYQLAADIIKKHGHRVLDDLEETEKFIKYIYDRFLDIPTTVKAEDFYHKLTFCPCCNTEPYTIEDYAIEKATIIKKNIEIYICKHCKVMWPTKDIRKENAQDYKKYMQSLGLKGTRKELEDIDLL